MSVHAPGRIVVRTVGRQRGGLGRAIARARPSCAPIGGGRRKLLVQLSMTSMIDVLVVVTLFLLLTFEAPSGECCVGPSCDHLPIADDGFDLIYAPRVDVRPGGIVVDGAPVASREDVSALQGRVARLDGLFTTLHTRQLTIQEHAPGREAPTHVMLAIDSDTPAHVVKSVMMTSASTGYSQLDLVVNRSGRPIGGTDEE